MIKTNSIAAWFLAARPKTLTAAAVPVLLGISLAMKDSAILSITSHGALPPIKWVPAVLCLLFAWIMQIDSNLVNDYFDFKHGNDDETRLGPKRACAEGWITLPAMKRGILITTLMGCAIGLPLVLFGGMEMIIVGILCVIFCFLYTTKLSYLGLGDLLVLVFFGIVPVCCTYYLVMPITETFPAIPLHVFLTSLACGLVVDTLLIVNNYRDYANDMKAGKKTLIVHMGRRNAEHLYCALGCIASLIIIGIIGYQSLHGLGTSIFLPFIAPYLVLHWLTYVQMKRIGEGRELNKILGMTARNIFMFGVFSCIAILGSALLGITA